MALFDMTLSRISFLCDFCNIVMSKEDFDEKILKNTKTNNSNHCWLGERAILSVRKQRCL